MPHYWAVATLVPIFVVSGCADPETSARIELHRQNALATVHAAREVFCALPPELRRELRAAGKLDPDFDSCATRNHEETAP